MPYLLQNRRLCELSFRLLHCLFLVALASPIYASATQKPSEKQRGARGYATRAPFKAVSQSNALFLPLMIDSRVTYYVDCAAGDDGKSGTSPTKAWKTLKKANSSSLAPGSQLLLKRGCAWTGRLEASWNGTPQLPILIGAYGDGDLPLIENGGYQTISITGAYQIIEYLQVHSDPLSTDPNCGNQPVGYTIGFNFVNGAAYNTVRYSKASGYTAGIRISRTAHHNRVLNNVVVENRGMEILDSANPSNDLGAWGMVVNGSDNEIAYNYLANNNALCSYDFASVGNSIELYEAERTSIHHNISVGDRIFAELGGSAARKSADNVFAYNLHVSAARGARFLVVKGAENRYGPTWRTTAYNNTIYLTDAASQGVVCSAGCSKDILTLKNNIIWAEEKAAFADGPFDESHNRYWNSAGKPVVQFLGFGMSSTSAKNDPLFIDPAALNFRVRLMSSAIDAGTRTSVDAGFTADADQVPVPQGGGVDIGAYEYQAQTLQRRAQRLNHSNDRRKGVSFEMLAR